LGVSKKESVIVKDYHEPRKHNKEKMVKYNLTQRNLKTQKYIYNLHRTIYRHYQNNKTYKVEWNRWAGRRVFNCVSITIIGKEIRFDIVTSSKVVDVRYQHDRVAHLKFSTLEELFQILSTNRFKEWKALQLANKM